MRLAIINRTGGGLSGGYLRYLENILPRFCCSPEIEKVLCALPVSVDIPPVLCGIEKLELCKSSPVFPFCYSPDKKLYARISEFRPDIVFVPTARHLSFPGIPQIAMIQNMAPFKTFGTYPLIERVKMGIQRLEGKYAFSKADKIIVMSKFVRDFITENLNVPAEKTAVVYFGTPEVSSISTKPEGLPSWLNGNFLFSAGSIEPYRGIEDIIFAVSRLKKSGISVKVVIAGGTRNVVVGYDRKLHAIAEEEGVAGEIIWLGSLNLSEMNWCYSNCSAFLMTSRIESFAVITLEAMAHGCVCLSVDMPPLPEAFDGAALYYAGGDHEALAGNIVKVLSLSQEERASLGQAARNQAARFTWGNTVSETISVFEKVIEAYRRDR